MSTIENPTGSTTIPRLPDTLRLGPVQLDVSNLDASIEYYERVLGLQLHSRHDGSAAMGAGGEDLVVLFEQPGKGGTINHLGVEVESTELVGAAQARLATQVMKTVTEDGVACCYARQDKVWVDGPSGEPWEIYTVLADVEMPGGQLRTVDPATGDVCCTVVNDDGAVVASSAPACC